MLLPPMFNLLSPAGPRARLSVLLFHRVYAEIDPLFPDEVDTRQFDLVCGWLAQWFRVLPMDEAVTRLAAGTLPSRALAISFDDGYADNRELALPILLKHGLTATFFIATGFLDGGRMWNDTVIESVRGVRTAELDLGDLLGPDFGPRPVQTVDQQRQLVDAILERAKYLAPAARETLVARIAERSGAALPDTLMMSSTQVRELRRAGMQIGAHTVSHPILAGLDAAGARREIGHSKRFLEDLLDEPVRLFAYPNGKPGRDFSAESVAIARELGFDAAVTTAGGVADRRTDRFQLPRFTPWDRTRLRFGARLLNNLRTVPA